VTEPERSLRSPALVVVVMSIASVMLTLDFFGVNVALPAIDHELHGSGATQQWIVNAYLLTLAAPLVAAGRVSDLLGRRRVLLAGTALFAVGCALSATAPTDLVIILGRAVAGFGAALVTATSLAIVSLAYPATPGDATAATRRARAIGAWTALGGIGAALGPLVAGLLTQGLGWRWMFGLNVPVALITAVLVWRVIPRDGPAAGHAAIDLVGTIGITLGLVGIVTALIEAPVRNWGSPVVLGALIAGIGVLALTARYERHRADGGLIPRAILRSTQFRRTSLVAAVANAAFSVTMFYLALYLQDVRHRTPTTTGLVFLAFTIPLMFASPFIGRVIDRLGGARTMQLGLIGLSLSFLGLAFLRSVGANEMPLVFAALIVGGLGQGLVFNATNVLALRASTDDDSGAASGAVAGVRQLGSLVGLAGAGAIFGAARGSGPFVDGLPLTMAVVAVVCVLAIPLARATPRERGAGVSPTAPR
jgi:MFS family permease